MAALEEALGRCREEIATHISQLGELEAAHRSEVDTLRNQVSSSQNSSVIQLAVRECLLSNFRMRELPSFLKNSPES